MQANQEGFRRSLGVRQMRLLALGSTIGVGLFLGSATAIELGAKVAVLEAGDKVGGSTALSAGIFYAAGTSVQRKRGDDQGVACLHLSPRRTGFVRVPASLDGGTHG